MPDRDLVTRVAALRVLADATRDAYDTARAGLANEMEPGDKLLVRSPSGTKLGAVSLTDPKTTCTVTSEQALAGWLAERYPEAVETAYEAAGGTDEVIGVLFEHAPHLLREVRRVKPDQLRELRENAIALGQPVGPGGEVDVPGLEVRTPPPVVATRLDPASARVAVAELWQAGALTLDSLLHPALPAPTEEDNRG